MTRINILPEVFNDAKLTGRGDHFALFIADLRSSPTSFRGNFVNDGVECTHIPSIRGYRCLFKLFLEDLQAPMFSKITNTLLRLFEFRLAFLNSARISSILLDHLQLSVCTPHVLNRLLSNSAIAGRLLPAGRSTIRCLAAASASAELIASVSQVRMCWRAELTSVRKLPESAAGSRPLCTVRTRSMGCFFLLPGLVPKSGRNGGNDRAMDRPCLPFPK